MRDRVRHVSESEPRQTLENPMGPRIADVNTHVPEIRDMANAIVKACSNGSVPQSTMGLVCLRAGQVVGNTYQAIRNSVDLRNAGESEERIASVATWWDAPYFTDAERAALTLTEAVFQPNPRGEE